MNSVGQDDKEPSQQLHMNITTHAFTTPSWLSTTWNFNGILTILSFSFGMYVVWFKSPKAMMQYKHALGAIVFYTSVFDIVINLLFRPVSVFPLWGGFSDSEVAKVISRTMRAMRLWEGDPTYLMPLIQLLCYEAFVSLVCGFLFRYWSLQGDSWPIRSVIHHYSVTFPIHISTAFPCPILCALARPPRASMVTYIYEKYPEFSALVNHSTWVIMNPDIDGGNGWSTAFGYCTVSIGLLYIASGPITLYLITKKLNKTKAHMSVKTYKLHTSLLISLCWQAAVPTVMYTIPLFTAAFILFFEIEGKTQGWMNIFFALMGAHSTANVILMCYFTKPYRDFSIEVLNRFGLFKKYGNKVVMIQTSQSANE